MTTAKKVSTAPPVAPAEPVPVIRPAAIYGLLIEAKKLVGGVPKSGQFGDPNKDTVAYNFRGVDQVVNAVAPVFADLGILGPSPEVVWSEHSVLEHQKSGNRGDYIQYAYRHLVRVRYSFIAASDGSCHSCVTEGEAIDYSDKGTAKAMSVALRVAILQALTLPTTDADPDAERPEINKPSGALAEPEPTWDEEDNKKVRDFLKAQSAGIQRSAKVFIRSQKIPLAKLAATEAQLNAIDEFVHELLEQEVERAERVAEFAEATRGERNLDDRVAMAKAATAARNSGEGK